MILYHFTALEYLGSIQRVGLTKGDVPLTPTEGLNAVWLTTDSSPMGHGLTDGRELTELEHQTHYAMFGAMSRKGSRYPNKRAVRIKVVISSTDRRLHYWPRWARKRLDPLWYSTLNETGGSKAHTWWIYFGVIRPDQFQSVETLATASLDANGCDQSLASPPAQSATCLGSRSDL